jgi:hypothetical protein
VRVPLRLAITDVMTEEQQQRVVGQVRVVGLGRAFTGRSRCWLRLQNREQPPRRACAAAVSARKQLACSAQLHQPATHMCVYGHMQGALWQDRLVAKLLQELQKGSSSPWYPYLQVWPSFFQGLFSQGVQAAGCSLAAIMSSECGQVQGLSFDPRVSAAAGPAAVGAQCSRHLHSC